MKKNKVAFVFHPLNIATLALMLGMSEKVLRMISKQWIYKAMSLKQPFILEKIEGLVSKSNSEIDLVCIVCPLLPEQMVTIDHGEAVQKVIESVRLAIKEGASLAVLAGFTSVIGNEGLDVANSVGINVTTGNTYTSALTLDGINKAAESLGVDISRCKCAVIGATGDIGSVCVRYLAQNAAILSLAARSESKLNLFANKIMSSAKAKVEVHKKTSEAIQDADIIISATSALTTIIDPFFLKPGAIVCDVSLPANIAREISRHRADLFIFEGGLCRMPYHENIKKSKLGVWWAKNAIYGCLGEGLILAHSNYFQNYSLGRGNISDDKIVEISTLAQLHGFELADFFCGSKYYSSSDVEFIKCAIHKRNQVLSIRD